MRELRGKPAAAKLLVESAAWVTQVPTVDRRREALCETADAILTCDDYKAGLNVLRTDPNAAWRSDTLASLAGWGDSSRQLQYISGGTSVVRDKATGSLAFPATPEGRNGLVPGRFNQSVDYRSVFGSGR